MPLGDDLLKMINKKFEPSANVSLRYGKYDLLLITNKDGDAMQLFIGKEGGQGIIKGDRYTRTLKYDREGVLIKNYWDRKGRST